eukprot:gb/GECG01001764.1/.p1 GENE.gb/GECG01001764.1/~~gb/GECG01001764.1/.p1  ORF type:complete len:140 (+),score=21.35 gb/GECG01001764.1/:1-420(+)
MSSSAHSGAGDSEGGGRPNKSPDKEGWLTKQSHWLREWRRRYFVLMGNQLFFKKDPKDQPHGVINLTQCLTVKSAMEKTGKNHSFEVATPDQTYFMYADSETDKDDWIGAIGRAIVRYSNSYKRNESADEESDVSSDDD